tara:strand:- start:43188 stop:43355 length:168 start_codon:yes stop_codon:yes gene_type:complete
MRKALIIPALALATFLTPAALADDADTSASPDFMEFMAQIMDGVVSFSRVIFIID